MKRKSIALLLVFLAVAAALLAAIPLTRNIGGIILYSVFGFPQQKTAKLFVIPVGTRFLSVGDEAVFAVKVSAQAPINLVAATLAFPKDMVELPKVSTENSPVNLWIRGPAVNYENGTIEFGGGIQRDEGFTGEGAVLTVTARVKKSGQLPIGISKATVLAHDGKGTESLGEYVGLTYMVRETGYPSPDFNGDGSVDYADISIFLRSLGRGYNPRYDLTGDGKTNVSDLNKLLGFAVGA